jgi:CBS domain-containing protein
VTVEPFWSIPGAAALMRDYHVKRLPVVRRGRVVGIVSRADIVRAIARTDAEIRQEVRDLIAFHQGLWSDSLAVDVSIVDGETTLTGEVQRRSMAQTLPELIARIPGVLNVRSELTWRDDDLSA